MPGEPDMHRTVEASLAEELVRIHVDSYGKGAGRTTVHIIDDAVICFLDQLELQRTEEFMINAGHGDAVVEIRTRYQAAIETTFTAVVERATGRRVVSFVSAMKLSPNYAVEIFRLGPPGEAPLEEPRGD
jgi:uncharacterized protein YbcI